MRSVTRTSDGSALNLDASDPSFGRADAAGVTPRIPRHRIRLRVSTGRGSSFTVNVCAGGYCTEQMRVLPVGTPVEGHVYLDDGGATFVGRVAWSQAGDSRLNQLGRMGVRFDRVEPQFVRGLAARVDRATRAPSSLLSAG